MASEIPYLNGHPILHYSILNASVSSKCLHGVSILYNIAVSFEGFIWRCEQANVEA